jgi:hypothetical protein
MANEHVVRHRRPQTLYLKVATISNKKLLVGRRSSLRGCRPGPEYGQQKIGPFANAGYLPVLAMSHDQERESTLFSAAVSS